MISKPFDKPRPPRHADPMLKAGWEAEQDAAFRLNREFGDPTRKDVRLFHDLRLPATFASGAVAEGDFFQIDHLVLHRHGTALIESKSVHGDLNVDHLGQWQRRSFGRTTNIASPVTQVRQQSAALRRLFQSAASPLLDAFLGIMKPGFRNFPASPLVAIGSKGRLTGVTKPHQAIVMKVDQVVAAVSEEIERHRRRAGTIGFVRGAIAGDTSDAGFFNLKPDEMDRIEQFLLARHTPLFHPAPTPAAPRSASPPCVDVAAAPLGECIERLESLTCGKCRSVNVKVVRARNYCLKCEECSKFSPLPYLCPLCGKHATVRKNGEEYFRDCDGSGGCGARTVFARSAAAR